MIARVIVTADDAGALPAIDESIGDLLERDVLSRAAVFPNGPSAAGFAGQFGNRYALGPHLTLTYGCPLGPANSVEPLLNDRGEFRQPLEFYDGDFGVAIRRWRDATLPTANPEAVERELARQCVHFEAIVESTGRHISFHHDIDGLFRGTTLWGAAPILGLGRVGRELRGETAGHLYHFLPPGCSQADAVNATTQLLEEARGLSGSQGGRPVEVVVHPAASIETLDSFTAYIDQRVLEYQALLSAPVTRILLSARRHNGVLEFT